MKTFLFAWNPKKWNWTTLEEDIDQIEQTGQASEKWSVISHKKIKTGDRAFLMRLGQEPKGIMGAGFVTSNPFLSPHWDGSGRLVNRVMIDFEVILNPEKEVLIPGKLDGCTLADSINAKQVQNLRKAYPDYTFVCYINTTADVKAECDVCVTSSNCYDIIEAIPNDKIMFLPDKLMGQNIIKEMKSRGVKKDIKLTNGTCYVHEEYAPEMIDYIRLQYPQAEVLSHPECHPNVIQKSDFIGSTAQLLKHMKSSKSKEFLLLTECGLSSHFQVEMPEKKIVGTCTLCKYMKSNTLENIFRVLKNPRPQDRIVIEESTRGKALKSLQEMFRYTENKVAVPAA